MEGTSKNLTALHFIDKKEGSKTFERLSVCQCSEISISYGRVKITKARSGQKESSANLGTAEITHPGSALSK